MDLSLLVTIATGAATGITAWVVARYKGKNDGFNSIIKANENFREEIRKDLLASRHDLELAAVAMQTMRVEIDELRRKLAFASQEIEDLRESLLEAKGERDAMIKKIVTYEVEIRRLQGVIVRYETANQTLTHEVERLQVEVNNLKQ